MPLPAVRCRPEQAGDKTVRTDCVCSGAHCAAVGGFAALRMRRALAGSDRLAGWQYLRYVFYGVRPPSLSFRGAKRRGNLAGPGWITGKFRQNRDCLPEIATAPSGPRNDTSGEHGAGNGALHRISRPIAASRTGLAVPDPTVTSLPIQTCKKIGSRLRPRPGSGCLFKKGRKKRESIGKLILQRSAAEAEAPREAVAAALLLLLALILLLALLCIA